jgi:circadian clock protein KaiB
MTTADHEATQGHPEPARGDAGTESYLLTLFVSGASDSSARAIANVREICDAHLSGRHKLSIVDLNQEQAIVGRHHVLATPTLVKDQPLPTRVAVGDMSDHLRILLALDIPVAAVPTSRADEVRKGQAGS